MLYLVTTPAACPESKVGRREFGNPTKYGVVSIYSPGDPRTYPSVDAATLAVDAT
jgi:hypothetical protein